MKSFPRGLFYYSLLFSLKSFYRGSTIATLHSIDPYMPKVLVARAYAPQRNSLTRPLQVSQ